jgi:hypothetical protein
MVSDEVASVMAQKRISAKVLRVFIERPRVVKVVAVT